MENNNNNNNHEQVLFTTPSDLSSKHREYLYRLWRSQRRELVDVITSVEKQEQQQQQQRCNNNSNSNSKKTKNKMMINNNNNTNGGKKSIFTPSSHAYHFCVRLHAFFHSFLKANAAMKMLVATTTIIGRGHEEQDNSEDEKELDDDELQEEQQKIESETTTKNATTTSPTFVKESSRSALKPYAKLALSSRTNKSTPSKKKNRLRYFMDSVGGAAGGTGRILITLRQEDFLSELNHFELRGCMPPTEQFLRRDSYGAFLYHVPKDALAAAGCAMALAIITTIQDDDDDDNGNDENTNITTTALLDRFLDNTQIIVRFIHVQPVVPMMDIKTGLVGKLLSVKGYVVKVRPKRLRLCTSDFSCTRCGAIITHSFNDGRYSIPTKCYGNSSNSASIPNSTNNNTSSDDDRCCRSKTFTMIRPTARYINAQEIRIQETQDESTMYAGRTPRQLEVEVTNELVDCCRPGDVVMVTSIVDAINTAVAAGKSGKRAQETSTYKLYLTGHSIVTTTTTTGSSSMDNNRQQRSKHGQGGGSSSSTVRAHYTQQQLHNIVQLCHADHRYFGLCERRAFPFDLLVRSFCPSIIGHDDVKAGLVLALLGGTPTASSSTGGSDGGTSGNGDQNSNSNNNNGTIRSNIHVLCCGDPGMGKSQLLLAATQLAPRSVFVGGNTSSTTGLTVTLTKEEKGESGLEAGALVLADQGVCAIDEFDKMAKANQDGLLEAMEQQRVSIAKAGVVASLPARCSVIAAANPRHGNYDMSQTVAENLNMSKPILSRFDLVFILRDRADRNLDRLVSSNIINLYRSKHGSNDHTNKNGTQSSQFSKNPQDGGGGSSNYAAATKAAGRYHDSFGGKSSSSEDAQARVPLAERLAWVADFQKQPLPADHVRDYIAYAREYCKPKLTREAAAVLKEYFMELRYPSDGRRKNDTVPITTRQLEALIRLSQARAKACLRDYVLKEDALDVVELMSLSVEQVHSDEYGGIDATRGGAGGKSKRKMKRAFVAELQRLVGSGAECSMDDLRRVATRVNYDLNDFHSMIEDLRNSGTLMKKSNGLYQVMDQ